MTSHSNPIDADHLEKYVEGDTALRDEILYIFSDQAESLDTEFDIALSDEAWSNTAHALKGAARGVGAWVLGDLCEEAELLIGQTPGKGERRAALMVSIRREIHACLFEASRMREAAA